jgi:hypothetical protein
VIFEKITIFLAKTGENCRKNCDLNNDHNTTINPGANPTIVSYHASAFKTQQVAIFIYKIGSGTSFLLAKL